MTWGFGNSAGLVQLRSFDEAKRKYDNTLPIRGRSKDCKPLGRNRRYNDRTIQKHWRAVDDGFVGKYVESYTANLWGTNYVEWFSDGKLFVRTGGYSSPTITATINYSVADGYGDLYSHNGKPYFRTKDGKSYLMTSEGLMLEPTGEQIQVNAGMTNVMRPLNPVAEYNYRANRKEMNKIRKHYRKFIDYGKAMYSIDSKIPEGKDNKQGWYHYAFTYSKWNNDQIKLNRDRLFKLIDEFIDTDNLEIAYKAACEVGHGFGWNSCCSTVDFERGVGELMKYRFKDSVFHKEAIEIGKAFYDRNAKYFM